MLTLTMVDTCFGEGFRHPTSVRAAIPTTSSPYISCETPPLLFFSPAPPTRDLKTENTESSLERTFAPLPLELFRGEISKFPARSHIQPLPFPFCAVGTARGSP
eukprot:RCo004961